MTALRREATAAGAALFLSFTLAACSGAPTDAKKSDFCAAAPGQAYIGELGPDADGEEIVEALEAWGDALNETGTPEGISDDAREGFDITVDFLTDLDPADFEDISDVATTDDLSDEEQDKVDAFNDYVTETCGDGSEDPS